MIDDWNRQGVQRVDRHFCKECQDRAGRRGGLAIHAALPLRKSSTINHSPLFDSLHGAIEVNLTGCAGIAEADRVAASIVATPCAISLLDPLLQIPIGSRYLPI